MNLLKLEDRVFSPFRVGTIFPRKVWTVPCTADICFWPNEPENVSRKAHNFSSCKSFSISFHFLSIHLFIADIFRLPPMIFGLLHNQLMFAQGYFSLFVCVGYYDYVKRVCVQLSLPFRFAHHCSITIFAVFALKSCQFSAKFSMLFH